MAFCLVFASRSFGDVRIEVKGSEPFVLPASEIDGSWGWYDAETLLEHFPGEVSRDASDGRLNLRNGDDWVALKAEPPYALRNGRPIKGVAPLKKRGGRLYVSFKFIRDFLSTLMDAPLSAAQSGMGSAKRIVLDAGHGGGDSGSLGMGSATEKDAMLALSRQIAKLLEKKGYEVHQTRETDIDMELEQRAAVANYWAADAFISLHASGDARPQARGFELMVAPVPPVKADPRAWQGGQVGRANDSRRLAHLIQVSLGEALSTFDRGMIEIQSPLLTAVRSPACLVEAGNLSWTPDAELLSGRDGKSLLANAVVKALDNFFSEN